MDYTERLKQNQTAQPTRLDYKVLELKRDEKTDKPFFAYWDKTEEKNVQVKPFKAVIIADAMQMTAWDNSANRTWKSGFIWQGGPTTIYDTTGSKAFEGAYQEALSFFGSKGLQPRKFKIFFVVDSKSDLYVVKTNLSLGIETQQSLGDDMVKYVMDIKPAIFDPSVNKKAASAMGKMALKNPPAYASITPTDKSVNEVGDKINLGEWLDKYEEWKARYFKEKTENEATVQVYEQATADAHAIAAKDEVPDFLKDDSGEEDPFA